MKPTQFALLASFFWVLTTHAATVRDLEFGTNGVLPSTDPDIEPFISPSLSETNVFSVTNGVLQQRTFGVAGSGTYQWPDAGFFFGTLDPALDFAMEARLRVLRIEGIGGAFFQAFNDVHQYAAFFTASGVQIRTNGGGFAFIPIDLTNLHTYRLEGLGNSDVMRLLVDGTNSFEGLAPAVSDFNGFSWGDDASGTGNGADVDWDYLRVSQLDPRTDCVQPPDSLVSLWKGEGNGNDTWSTNHGTLQNGAGFAPGRVGQAFSFDGVAGYVRIPVQPALLLDHFSIAAWVKPNALVDDPSGEEVLFAQDDGRPQLVVRTGTSGMKVAIQFRASTNYPDCVSRSEIPIGNFSHVAGTWDGLTLRLFINGLLDNEVVANDAPTNTMRDFFIGGINDPPVYVGQFFNGLIDESALFRSAIPSNEIAVLYAAGSAGMCGPGQVPTVAVDLQSGSDTGASNTDNLTSDTTPSFDITINRPGDIQFFYSGGTNADEVRTNLDAGTFAFTTPSLSDGVHTVTARFVPFSGNPVQASLAVTIDTRGPRVVASTLPAGATLNDTLDGVEVTFDSAIDPASLTVADVTLSGPGGSIAITSIAPLSSNQFLISFPVQRADGEYDVTLGPNVADLAGNLMDQDGDGINGESPQDVFIVHFTLSLPDLAVTQVNVPLIAPAGQLVPIIWTMTNSGRATAIAPWNNTVVLANDATGNGSQTLASVPATISLVPGSSLTQTSTVLLPADMFGQKYVLVTVNSGGQVPETDESNNTLAAAQPIQILGPDLVVESVAIHPPSPHFGDAVDLVWTVRNVGTGPALNPWSDRLQLSTDTIVGGDTLLLTLSADDVVPLAAGAAYTRTQSVTLPLGPTLPSGTYFLLAESDIAAQLPELNEFNNFRFSDPISISQPPLPDLMVADILSPTNGFAGHPVTVSWVITNQGAATAIGPWADTILLATNSQGGNAVPLATFNYSTNLAAGASLTRGGAVLLPAEFFGELFFVVQTDSSNQVYESTETNNLAVASIRIHIQASDLIVTDLQAPGDTLTDRSFEVTWTVENHSEAPAAGSWLDQVYLRFPGPSGTNLLLGTFPFNDGLAPGQSVTRIQAVSIPRIPLVTNGDYLIVVVTDAANSLREGLNETNNTLVADQFIHVTRNPLPDLVVDSIDAATTAFGGQTLTVHWTVRNVGQADTDTPVWHDLLLLAPTPSGADAMASAGAANVSYLGTNEGYIGSANITIPRTAFLTLYFVLKTDSENNVQEENETNNVASKAIEVMLLNDPDLKVTEVHVQPHETFSAQSIAIRYTVENQGVSVPPNQSSWSDTVYLSPDQNFTTRTPLGSFRHTGILTNGESYTVSNLTVTLPRNISGTNYIFVATDVAAEVFEYFYNQVPGHKANLDTNGIIITRIPGPDLVVNSVSATANVLAGQPVSITWRVTNEGACDTAASLWYDSVYVSTDTTLDGSDTLVGYVYHAGLMNFGDSYTASITYTSSVCASGPLYFFVVADSYRQVDEYDPGGEANNTNQTARATQVVPVPTPDLQVTSFSAPSSGDAGATIRVNWSVRNASASAAATGDWVDRVYLTRGTTFEASSPVAAFAHTNGLAPGTNYSRSEDVPLPSNASGLYYVFTKADADDAITECAGEGNNTRSSPDVLNVRPIPLPDLQIVSVAGPGNTPSGQSITVSWTGTNTGPGHISGSWVDYIYLSSSPISLAGATFLGLAPVTGPLLAGMGYQVSTNVQLPYRLSGSFYLIVYADAQSSVAEGPNEQNNLTATPLQVTQTVLADLQTSAVSVPASGVAGLSVDVSWTVTNTGLGPTERPTWTDYIYLSRDQVLDPSDPQLAYVPHSGALDIGQGYTQNETVTLPRGLSGAYYVFVCADRNDVVLELDENNNCARAATPIQITLPPPVDLVVTSVSAPGGTYTPGQSATFNWSVLNQGGNTVSGSWQDSVYISTNSAWDIAAPLLGKAPRSGPLSPGGSYPGTLTAALPGVLPGQYYVIVRADILNNVRETNEVNNLGVSSGTFGIDIPELQLGVAWPSNLVQDAEHYYKVRTPSNETMLVTLDAAATNGFNELFTRFGAVPNRGQYDFLFNNPFQPDQQIVVPETQAGYYYHLVRGESVPTPQEDYAIKAELLPFEIRSVSPTHIGDNGQVTIKLTGARFEAGATVTLETNGVTLAAAKVIFLDAATLKARFLFENALHGQYDVVLTNPNGSRTFLQKGVVIETTTGPRVDMGVTGNLSPRFGRPFGTSALVLNVGNADIPYLAVFAEFPGKVAMEFRRAAETLPRQTDTASFASDPSVSVCQNCRNSTIASFTLRDLRPGDELPFEITVRGFPSGPFTIKLLAQPMTASDFVSGLQDAAENSRQFVLADPGFAFPDEFVTRVGDSARWWEFFEGQLVTLGYLDQPISDGSQSTERTTASTAIVDPCQMCRQDCERIYGECVDEAWNIFKQETPYCVVLNAINPIWGRSWQIAISLELQVRLQSCKEAEWFCKIADCFRYCYPPPPPPPPPPPGTPQPQPHPTPPPTPGWNPIPMPPGGGDGTPSGGALVEGDGNAQRPADPNEMVGPPGYGVGAFLSVESTLPFTINFENVTNATAAAQRIRVIHQPAPSLDVRSVRLNEIGFGSYHMTVPNNRSFYQTRVQLGPEFNNLLADISAGLDLQSGEVRWTLTAIDPATGEPPESAALGLLPPNNTNHVGEGYVTYTIRPKAGTPTGTVITNQATIIFDNNEPSDTNPVWNTIDGAPPASAVAALPAVSPDPSFPVSWSGADDAGGSGLQSFDLYVSDNGGLFQLWLSGVTNTTATYDGVAGHTYSFYSVSRDNSGNVEPPPDTPDTQTTPAGNTPPALAPIADQIAFVGQTLTVTNSAVDFDLPPQTLTFSLDPGAPSGASINPTNGIFRWTPTPAQASTTNVITVRVTDNGTPVRSTAQTFTVIVPDFLELGFGTVVVRAGASDCLPITVFSSVGLNRLSIRLQLPPGLTSLALENVAPQFCSNTLETNSPTEAVIRVETCPGLFLQGTQFVAYLRFTASSNQSSAFAPLRASEVTGSKPDGSSLTNITLPGGRLVVVGPEPLLEALLSSNQVRTLVLYGQPDHRYAIESTPVLPAAAGWSVFQEVVMTDELKVSVDVPSNLPSVFYRAKELVGLAPLNIHRTQSGVMLEWSSDCQGCVLEETSSLGQGGIWSSSATQPQLTGGRYQATVPATIGSRFYRLRRP